MATARWQRPLTPTIEEDGGHGLVLRLDLLASQLLLILVQEEGTVGGHGRQWLEDVRHGAEAVLGGGVRLLRQQPLLGADRTELEVFAVHGDVGGQGLQVQLTEVRLRTRQRERRGEAGIALRMLFPCPALVALPVPSHSCTASLQQCPFLALAPPLIPVAHHPKTQIRLLAVQGSWPGTLAFPGVHAPNRHALLGGAYTFPTGDPASSHLK